jgi:hypothetical protein
MIKDPIERLQDGQHDGYSKEFLAAIDKGLAVKPEDRPRSIEEFRQLLQLELSVPVPTPGATIAPPAPPASPASPASSPRAPAKQSPAGSSPSIEATPKLSSTAVLALAVAAIVSGLGIAAYSSFRHKAPTAPAPVAQSSKPGMAPERVVTESAVGSEQKAVIPATAEPAAQNQAKADGIATVRLNIKPWGTVFVDGVSQGVSPPLKKLDLAEGKHKIRIENPSFPSHTIDVDVTKKKTGSIEHDFSPNKK